MILYHGSNMEISVPDLSKSRPYKDFGRGFYLSADERQAYRMAELRTSMMRCGVPTVTRFEFDETVLTGKQLQCLTFEDYTPEWAQFVVENRDIHHPQPVRHYDIVYGPIADDSVTYQLRRYIAGGMSIEELIRELRYAKGITFQYYFGSEAALRTLHRL